MPGGSRYNKRQTDEERRAYENLLLLCYPHHIETNDGDEYPVEKLRNIKQIHEATHEASRFQINEAELLKLVKEMEKFWAHIERLNRVEHSMQELAFEINAKGTFFDLLNSIRHAIDSIEGFLDLADARRTIEAWRVHYNTVRPHSSLGFLSPELFRMAGETSCGKAGRSATLENSSSFPLSHSHDGGDNSTHSSLSNWT